MWGLLSHRGFSRVKVNLRAFDTSFAVFLNQPRGVHAHVGSRSCSTMYRRYQRSIRVEWKRQPCASTAVKSFQKLNFIQATMTSYFLGFYILFSFQHICHTNREASNVSIIRLLLRHMRSMFCGMMTENLPCNLNCIDWMHKHNSF